MVDLASVRPNGDRSHFFASIKLGPLHLVRALVVGLRFSAYKNTLIHLDVVTKALSKVESHFMQLATRPRRVNLLESDRLA